MDFRAKNPPSDPKSLLVSPSMFKMTGKDPKNYPLDVYIREWYIAGVMIELRLAEMLELRGRTAYWLSKQTGVRYATIWEMANGQITRLNLDILDLICEALECEPSDLMIRASKSKQTRKGK